MGTISCLGFLFWFTIENAKAEQPAAKERELKEEKANGGW